MKKIATEFTKLVAILLLSIVTAQADSALLMHINGAIGPATHNYIQRGLEKAAQEHAVIVILQLDTPGGLATSTYSINKAILASPVPVAAYVAPTGARAASAGTYILYASQIAAMAPGTHLGAASPVHIGETQPTTQAIDDKHKLAQINLSTADKKEMNDASAYIRSLALLHSRNAAWGEDAVRNAVTLSATEALQQKVIDVLADSPQALLQQVNGKMVKVNDKSITLATTNLSIQEFQPDWRDNFLSAITEPNIAYILLLIGIYGLFFEFYNPGFVLPGVMGGISLLIALYAFQLLPVNYVGFALLLLGITFMIIEVLISSFGILGIGGIISFITGSILLLDINSPGYGIAWSLIATMTIFTTVFFLILISLTVRAMRRKVVTGREALIGSKGAVLQILNSDELLVKIQGEIWKASSLEHLRKGQKIRVCGLNGLALTVEPLIKSEPPIATE